MNSPKITNRHLLTLIKSYWQWRLVWIATTVLFGGLGLAYAVLGKKDRWVASQGLIVRDEANGGVMRLGRFESQTEMKAAQETILEMARNPQVLRAALSIVGPESTGALPATGQASTPTAKQIESLAKDGIEVRAPRGAELGTTEVIYLDVTANTPERAIALNRAVTDELAKHLQQVRRVRADGVITELETAAQSASVALEESTTRLKKLEESAGADLSDLRSLTDANVGGSANRTRLDSVKSELLAVELRQQQLVTEHQVASESLDSPKKFLSAPAKVLSSNPGLLKLREGLAEASITRSELLGRFTKEHPMVKAAIETEAKIVEQIRDELTVAVDNLEQDLEYSAERARRLKEKQTNLEYRLTTLAGVRADYANVASDVQSRNEQLQRAEMELASAVASRNAASTSSLVTRLDDPIVGDTPIGPGKATIAGGATVCGLMFGLGIVFLLSPMELQSAGSFGRRSSDFGGQGRRQSDQMRVADAEAIPTGGERRSRPSESKPSRVFPAHPGKPAFVEQPSAKPAAASLKDSSGCEDSLSQELLGGLGELSFAEHANTVLPKPGKPATAEKDRETPSKQGLNSASCELPTGDCADATAGGRRKTSPPPMAMPLSDQSDPRTSARLTGQS